MEPLFRNANMQMDYSQSGSKFKQISREEDHSVQWLKYFECDDKDEDSSPDNVNSLNLNKDIYFNKT